MNAIRQTQQLNKRELENATPPSASWHADYRDTAYIYIGGLPLDLSEGDVVTIFSQYGNPTHLNMIRDKETGKSKGFAFLKYEDQRSCDLAVDNLGGAEVLGRMLRVDHTRYKKRDDEDENTYRIDRLEAVHNENGKRSSDTDDSDQERHRKRMKKGRPLLKEEQELEEMLAITQDGEEQDPMREYLIKEKRAEVERAKEREKRHRHKHRHRDRADEQDEEDRHRHKHRHRDRLNGGDDNGRHTIDREEERRQKYRREDDDEGDRRQRRNRSVERSKDDRNTERRSESPKRQEDSRRRRDYDATPPRRRSKYD